MAERNSGSILSDYYFLKPSNQFEHVIIHRVGSRINEITQQKKEE